MFSVLLLLCSASFCLLTAAPIVQKTLLKDEPAALQNTAVRSPPSPIQTRFIFIAPDRPMPTYNPAVYGPQFQQMQQTDSDPSALVLDNNGAKLYKYSNPQENDFDGSDIKFPTDLSVNDFLPRDNIQKADDLNSYRTNQLIKYRPLTAEKDLSSNEMGIMSRQGLNPLSLLSGLLGGGSEGRPGSSRENQGNREPREREQGLLNGLLTLPEIFLSIS